MKKIRPPWTMAEWFKQFNAAYVEWSEVKRRSEKWQKIYVEIATGKTLRAKTIRLLLPVYLWWIRRKQLPYELWQNGLPPAQREPTVNDNFKP